MLVTRDIGVVTHFGVALVVQQLDARPKDVHGYRPISLGAMRTMRSF